MPWHFVLAFLLLSLPGCLSMIIADNTENEHSHHLSKRAKEFVPELDIEQIIHSQSLQKPQHSSLADSPSQNNAEPDIPAAQDPAPVIPPDTPVADNELADSNVGDGEGPSTLPPHPTPAHMRAGQQREKKTNAYVNLGDVYFVAIVAGCSVAGFVGLIVAGVCWYKLQKRVKAASDIDYPAYGVTGPNKGPGPPPGDRKLAQSAQMYHYQHQKQQMIAMEKANGDMKTASDDESEEENDEGDYTVYECPGLAPTGEMEVKNPLFPEDTPVEPTPPDIKPNP